MSLEINKQDDITILNIKPDNIIYWILGFVSLIFLGFIYVFYQAVYQMITGDLNIIFIVFIGFFFWMAYYNFFNFYFMILGSEIIEITDSYIKQTRVVWKIKHSKKYSKSKIKNIEILDSSNKFGADGIKMFGLSNINVTFKIGRKKKMIGKNINMDDAKLIIKELENRKYATHMV